MMEKNEKPKEIRERGLFRITKFVKGKWEKWEKEEKGSEKESYGDWKN